MARDTLKLENIPIDDRRQFLNGFVTQTQADLDKAREQLGGAQRKLAEAIVRHEVFKANGLDTTKTENAIKAQRRAVTILGQDVARLEQELQAYQSYMETL